MYYDGFELLSQELLMEPAVFCQLIRQDPDAIIDQVRQLRLARIPLILAEDFSFGPSQAAFMTKGTDLLPHLKGVFGRLCRKETIAAVPLILPTTELNQYLKAKISRAFGEVARKLLDQRHLGRIYACYEKNQDLMRIATYLGELVDPYLVSPAVIKGVLAGFAGRGAATAIEENTKAAFVAMAILSQYDDSTGEAMASRKNRLVEMGMSLLFQDIACTVVGIVHDARNQEHAEASAVIAADMKLSHRCVETIRQHHRSTDASDKPILLHQAPPLFERVAVLANAFIDCIADRGFGLYIEQAIYVLEHYARQHYYDLDCLQILSRLSLGEGKQRIIAKSFDFQQVCPQGAMPVLWDVRSKLPNRLICNRTGCPHLSAEEVVLYAPIRWDHHAFSFHIPAGRYYKCIRLTRRFNQWMMERKIFMLTA